MWSIGISSVSQRRSAMKMANIILRGCMLMLFVACGARATTLSQESIVGTWFGVGSGEYFQFNEDGTYTGLDNREAVATNPDVEGEYKFDGTRIVMTSIVHPVCPGTTGTYEVELLENGNLRFTVVEDECQVRTDVLQGRGFTVEYTSVE
jgi:hypothetical protein